MLYGSNKTPASAITSGNEAAKDAAIGTPQAIASRTGKPKPSYKDGITKRVARLYIATRSSAVTSPRYIASVDFILFNIFDSLGLYLPTITNLCLIPLDFRSV